MDWTHILERARAIAASYDTPVTLRQLYYRLVAAELIPNSPYAYKHLSAVTAGARRAGTFPALVDLGRGIRRLRSFTGTSEARAWLRDQYHRDRTEEQPVSLYLAVEKAGIVAQLEAWFGGLGVSVLALGGYASQTLADEVRWDVSHQGRPAVLIYAGDFDPTGEDIDRDFVERTDCWAKVQRVALNADQVETYNLPPQPGKASDTRASSFVARHGRLVQVELDALPPDTLRQLYADAVADYWDDDAHDRALALEALDRRRL